MLAACAVAPVPRRFDVEPQGGRGPPVVLVHGLLAAGSRPQPGFDTFGRRIVRALEDAGFSVWQPALPAIAPPEVRAPVLLRAIDEVLARSGARCVLLIAHSQGGVDARLVLDDPRALGKVCAVATLSTPHAGTPMAEVALHLHGSLSESFIDRTALHIDRSRGWPPVEGRLYETSLALTPEAMRAFDRAHPRAPVPFFSLAATPEPARDGACDDGLWPAPTRRGRRSLALVIGAQLLEERDDPSADAPESNDGFIPTRSMRFGLFLGCAPFDHGGWLHADRGADVPGFYVELARGLAEAGKTGDASVMRAHAARLAARLGVAP